MAQIPMYTNYGQYLRSQQWDKLRLATKNEKGYECANCSYAGTRIEVHHWHRGKQWGLEDTRDLVPLCRFCHHKIESLLRFNTRRYVSLARSFMLEDSTAEYVDIYLPKKAYSHVDLKQAWNMQLNRVAF